MTKQATAPMEPCCEELGGDSAGQRARRMFLAIRPKFLTASILPVIVGTAWGAAVAGEISWGIALLAVLATALVHAASNVINDVSDDTAGGDRVNVERIYPYTGGSRFIQNEIMTAQEMKRLGYGLLAAAGVLGIVLAMIKGPLVLGFGLAGVAIALLYSLPSVQLAGRGVGELCILVAFGLLPVCGAAWLQSGIVDGPSVLVAIPVGLWVTLILLINEVPDRRSDEASGKRTLVVRLGIDGTRKLYLALHVAAFTCVLALALTGLMPWWTALGAALILAGGIRASQGIGDPGIGREALTRSIETTLGLQAAGSVLMILGAIF